MVLEGKDVRINSQTKHLCTLAFYNLHYAICATCIENMISMFCHLIVGPSGDDPPEAMPQW